MKFYAIMFKDINETFYLIKKIKTDTNILNTVKSFLFVEVNVRE